MNNIEGEFIEIDKNEFVKQEIELIKKSNSYLEYKAIIPKFQGEFTAPIISFEPHNVGPTEAGLLLFSIEQSVKNIMDMPGVKIAYKEIKKEMKFKVQKIEVNDDEKNNKRK